MASRIWKQKPNFSKKKKDNEQKDFFLFGYSCKLFRDDETAFYIDQGKHLIPWMGDESLLIDRYDGRGHLSDLRPYDGEHVLRNMVERTATEKAVEEQCERERYLEFSVDMDEEATREEEEWKRYYEAVNDNGFNAIGFSYDNQYDPSEPTDTEVIEDAIVDAPYVVPQNLVLPPDIITPSTMKHHHIIEKTAQCVAEHGIQMEIMIRTKQADNQQLDFLHYDHQLYPYYRHLMTTIKSGFYKPIVVASDRQNSSYEEDEDDDMDDTYLHPSLMAPIKVETRPAPVFSMEGTAYGNLVRNLMDIVPRPVPPKVVAPPPRDPIPEPAAPTSTTTSGTDSPVVRDRSRSSTPVPRRKKSAPATTESESVMYGPTIVPPPPDLQPIIDRMAQYVVKNGQDFEEVVKGKKDRRFAFILAGDMHNPYYVFKKNFFSEEKLRYEEEQRLSANRSISFSLKPKSKETEPVLETKVAFEDESTDDEESGTNTAAVIPPTDTLPQDKGAQPRDKDTLGSSDDKKHAEEKIRDRLSAAARVKNANLAKDKQLQAERKKRAAMFVNMLKSSTSAASTTDPQGNVGVTLDSGTSTPMPISQSPSPSHSRSRSPQTFDYDHTHSAPKRNLPQSAVYKSGSTSVSQTVEKTPRVKEKHKKKERDRKSKRTRSQSPGKKSSKLSRRDKSPTSSSSKRKSKHKHKKHSRRKRSESGSDVERSKPSTDDRSSENSVPVAEPSPRPSVVTHTDARIVVPHKVDNDAQGTAQDTKVPMSDMQINQFRAMVKARRQALWDEKKAMDGTT